MRGKGRMVAKVGLALAVMMALALGGVKANAHERHALAHQAAARPSRLSFRRPSVTGGAACACVRTWALVCGRGDSAGPGPAAAP